MQDRTSTLQPVRRRSGQRRTRNLHLVLVEQVVLEPLLNLPPLHLLPPPPLPSLLSLMPPLLWPLPLAGYQCVVLLSLVAAEGALAGLTTLCGPLVCGGGYHVLHAGGTRAYTTEQVAD